VTTTPELDKDQHHEIVREDQDQEVQEDQIIVIDPDQTTDKNQGQLK